MAVGQPVAMFLAKSFGSPGRSTLTGGAPRGKAANFNGAANMMHRQSKLSAMISLVLAGLAAQADAAHGHSNSTTPYLSGIKTGVHFNSMQTVGDTAPTGYRMAGHTQWPRANQRWALP